MTKLLLASTNPGKVRELLDLLGDLAVEVVTPQQIGLSLDIEEDGVTYAENAAIKAETYARRAGLINVPAASKKTALMAMVNVEFGNGR